MSTLVRAFLFALLSVVVHSRASSGDLDPSFAGTGMARVGFGLGQDYGQAVATQADGKVVIAGTSGPFTFGEEGYVGGHFSLTRLLTNGSPDVSFGFGGTVQTPVSARGLAQSDGGANAVRIQADGKIVAAGYAYTRSNHMDFTLVRYNPDGSVDTSFGTSGTGIVHTDFGEGSKAMDVVIQADGRIVVVGFTLFDHNAGEGSVALARYLTNGVLDGSFGNGGKQTTTVIKGYTGAHAATIQPDGKILAVGIGSGPGSSGIDFGLYRYTTNGFLDGEFGGGSGKVFTAITTNVTTYNYFDYANAVTIQPGDSPQNPDKILVAGTYWNMKSQNNSRVIALTRYSMNGTLDSTFGHGGIVTNGIGTNSASANGIMVVGDSSARKILVAGSTGSGGVGRILLARYTLSGVLDNTFNGTGYVTSAVGSIADEGKAISRYGDKIVIAGSSYINEHNSDFAVARFNADGSPDTSFHQDGKTSIGVADHAAAAKAVATQPDGKTVIAGYAHDGLKQVMALVRLNAEGLPDTSFGVDGKVLTPIGEGARANAVAIQPDGKIVSAGVADNDFAVVRYHPNGDPDHSFGLNGIAKTPFGTGRSEATSVVLQPDGRVVVAGLGYSGTNPDFAIVRYTTNGIPDSSFDLDGKILTPIGSAHDAAYAVKIQPDGRIVVAGLSVIGTTVDISLVRYLSNGLLDNSFGTLGRVVTDVAPGSHDFGHALAIQPNGKILVGGISGQGVSTAFAALRYHTNGTLDLSFDGDGKVTTAVGFGLDDKAFAMALQGDGKIVLAGTSTAGGPQFSAVRYREDGSLDDSFGFEGRAITQFDTGGENIGYAVAFDTLGRVVIAGDADGLFGVARLQADTQLTIRIISRMSDGWVTLEGSGVPGIAHTVEAGSSLGTFAPLGTVTPDGLGHWRFEYASPVASGSCFYRISRP